MGLLSIIRKLREEEREMRVLILGLDGAGKTTIVKKIMGRDVNVIEPTLGFNIETIPIELEGDSQPYQVNVWDVGGQKSIRTFWKNYFEQTEGLVWVVDCSDRSRLETCKEELSQLLLEERLDGATLLVMANKQDLPGAASVDEIQKLLGLDDITTHHWSIRGCSGVKDESSSLNGHLKWLTGDVASRCFSRD